MRDLALLVRESDTPHHCELDLTALTTTVNVPVQTCAATRLAGDDLTGLFFAAGDTCAMIYAVSSTAATTLQIHRLRVRRLTISKVVLDKPRRFSGCAHG